MKITKLGHCCLVVEVKGVKFLTDPGAYTTAQNEAKGIHYVVISHEHTDHLHIESLKTVLKNNPQARVITNNSVGKILEKENIAYLSIANGEKMDCDGVEISGHGVEHAPIYKDYERVENTGYLFDKKMFYPGDAFHTPDVPVDILALPVSGPWCTIAQAMEYALDVKPRAAFAVHDGNLIRPQGITQRLPKLFLSPTGIEFIVLELGKETEV